LIPSELELATPLQLTVNPSRYVNQQAKCLLVLLMKKMNAGSRGLIHQLPGDLNLWRQ
jgi:hypothetical protein